MLIYPRLRGKLAAEFIAERALGDSVDKIFVDEAVNELHTIQDMLRWAVSRFSAANIWYGHVKSYNKQNKEKANNRRGRDRIV